MNQIWFWELQPLKFAVSLPRPNNNSSRFYSQKSTTRNWFVRWKVAKKSFDHCRFSHPFDLISLGSPLPIFWSEDSTIQQQGGWITYLWFCLAAVVSFSDGQLCQLCPFHPVLHLGLKLHFQGLTEPAPARPIKDHENSVCLNKVKKINMLAGFMDWQDWYCKFHIFEKLPQSVVDATINRLPGSASSKSPLLSSSSTWKKTSKTKGIVGCLGIFATSVIVVPGSRNLKWSSNERKTFTNLNSFWT